MIPSPDPVRLCWWEVSELLEHLQSRPDIWIQSEDNEDLWVRNDREGEACFGLLLGPLTHLTSPFRLRQLITFPMRWDTDYVDQYISWLVGHWTTFRQRAITASFLRRELHIDPETAALSAIALEGLAWEDEVPEPSAPPLQEELWPEEMAPPAFSFTTDPTLISTSLLQHGAGWLQLRIAGGQLRITLNLKSKDGSATLVLQGHVRPGNGKCRDAAAKLAGWPDEQEQHDTLDTSSQQSLEHHV